MVLFFSVSVNNRKDVSMSLLDVGVAPTEELLRAYRREYDPAFYGDHVIRSFRLLDIIIISINLCLLLFVFLFRQEHSYDAV